MRRMVGLVLGVLVASLGGCTARMDVPVGYVKLRDPRPYTLKAVSARGNVVALRTHANEDPAANLDFWSQAIEHQKVDLDGLRLAGRESIKSAAGLDGVLFNFELGEGQGKVTYLTALYVTPQQIITIEAAGPTDQLAADMDKLRPAILSLRHQ